MLFIKNIVLSLGILIATNSVNAISDESLEPDSKVLIVYNYSSLSREYIEKNGLDAPAGKIYFEFIPGITKENIPENHVAKEVKPHNTWVYNGNFLDGKLPIWFKNFYNLSCMLLSTYIEMQDLALELKVLSDETLIFDPITAYPKVVSKNNERVLKDLSYKSRVPANIDDITHHFIYRPIIAVYGDVPANKLIFPAVKSSSGSRNISGTHPITCRPYSTYIRALRRFF